MARAFAEIDREAITANTRMLRSCAAGAALCAVVKADGYGHGAVTASEAALAGGATRLGVAQVQEGIALREAGLDVPIWLFSEPHPRQFADCVRYALEPPLYSRRGLDAAEELGSHATLTVHLMIDTGMHRVGCSPDEAPSIAARIEGAPGLVLGSVWTHLAVADEPGNPYTDSQLDRFDTALAAIERTGTYVAMTHAANSAATIAVPRAHRDVVRPGVSLYGMPPSPALAGAVDLVPALRLWTEVSFVKRLRAGDRVSYGLRSELARDATVATLPVGYADGVRRRWWETGAVLVHGHRCPIVGVVTMDQLMIDCGDLDVVPGDEAVLIGRQGNEEITASDWAAALGTINYEITCGIGPRVQRIHAVDRAT